MHTSDLTKPGNARVTEKERGGMVNKVPADRLEMQLRATDITQQRDSVPSDLISGFRSIDEDLQGQTFLTCLLYTNSEQREKRHSQPKSLFGPGADVSLSLVSAMLLSNHQTVMDKREQ